MNDDKDKDRQAAQAIINNYIASAGDTAKCPHCGKVFTNEMLRDDKRVPTHDYPKPCRSVCPGSGQLPIPDETPLVDAIATALAARYQQGLDDGHSAQAIMELQGRDRFIAELKSKEATALAVARKETWEQAVGVAKGELWSDAITLNYPHRAEQNDVTRCVVEALEAAAREGE